jgi:hypothetical protein
MGSSLLVALALSSSAGSWSVRHNGTQEIRVTWGSGLHGYQHLILALRAYLRRKVESMDEGDLYPSSITWTSIEEEMARDFCVRREHLTEIRRIFLDEGDVVVFGTENARGGAAAENYDHSSEQKVSIEHLKEMVKFIDQQHSEGRSVSDRKVRNWLRQDQGIEASRRTI